MCQRPWTFTWAKMFLAVTRWLNRYLMSVVAQWSSGDLSILYIDSKCGGFGVLYVGSYLCVHSGYLSVCLSLSWLALTNVEGETFSLGKSTKSLAVSDGLSVSCRALTAAVSTPTGTYTLQHHLQGFLLHGETSPFLPTSCSHTPHFLVSYGIRKKPVVRSLGVILGSVDWLSDVRVRFSKVCLFHGREDDSSFFSHSHILEVQSKPFSCLNLIWSLYVFIIQDIVSR